MAENSTPTNNNYTDTHSPMNNPSANNPSTNKPNKNPEMNNTAAPPAEFAWAGWVIFGLFFIGALCSCIGGCWGMACRREEIL